MSAFPTVKHLVSWAGRCPRNDQINRQIKSTRISRAGSYLESVLVRLQMVYYVLTKKHLEITDLYKRIKARPVKESKVLTASQAFNLLKQREYIIKDDSVPAS
ncbi:hypothetical protein D5282_07005 [bacterium 1xD8-48]|jgi:transposase|nr:IS110 family transposase [Lachnospiraceae bacterium]MCI9324632.1 IS110 family transposase [Lachnospiraceae bacterium]NBJ97080.1 hypothetical protein [bacterium 1xD8-48]